LAERFGPQAVAEFAAAYGTAGFDASKARYFADLYELF
jgi:hypothetical protein